MKSKKTLILILVLAAFLRLYKLSTVPSLGLTEFSVRFPNAIFGIAGVYALYLLVKELFSENLSLPLISAFMLAINPWHMYFSRGVWEANVALTITIFAVYFFLKAFQKQKYILLSGFLFVLTLVIYSGSGLATAIVVLILVLLYWKKIVKFKPKILVPAVVLGFLITLPVVVSISSYERPGNYLQGGENVGSFQYYLFHSEAGYSLKELALRWFNHFSGRFLFFEGDWQNPRYSPPHQGMLLVADLFVLAAGVLYAARKKMFRGGGRFILLWLLLSPLPSVLSQDQVNAFRSFNMVVPLAVVLAFGVIWFYEFIQRQAGLVRALLIAVCMGLYFFNYAYFLDSYFVHLPKQRSQEWHYGYKQTIKTILPMVDKYEIVAVK